MPIRTSSVLFPVALAALALAGAAPAHAGILPLIGPVTLDAAGDPPEPVLPPLPDLTIEAQRLIALLDRAYDAAVTDNILRAVGSMAHARPTRAKADAADPRTVFAARLNGPMPGSPPLDKLANPTFGSRDGVALSFRERLTDKDHAATGIATQIGLAHQGAAIDAGFNLAATRDFTTPDPMAVRYDGHAMVAVSPAMQLGMAARGSLGTTSALAFAPDQIAGPRLRLNLGDKAVSLVSDLGYDFDLRPNSAESRANLHVAMALKIKL